MFEWSTDESFDKNSKLENNFLGYQWVIKKVGGVGKLEKLGVLNKRGNSKKQQQQRWRVPLTSFENLINAILANPRY